MSKRRKRLMFAGCALVLFAAVLLLSREPEPHYQGRSLTQWLSMYEQQGTEHVTLLQGQEAAHALRLIGTNALHCYFKWIRYEPRPWQKRLSRFINRLPEPLSESSLHDLTYSSSRLSQSMLADVGFKVLGRDAAPAIPELTRLLNDPTSPQIRERAAHALASIGAEGLPPLLGALANTNYPGRATVASIICLMSDLGTNARPAVPVLIRCTRDSDNALAAMAIQALGSLHIDQEAVVPALIDAFRSKDKDVRFWAVRSFDLWFDAEAHRAAPALRGMLNDPDYRVSMYASNILVKVASEARTNAAPK